MQCKCCGEEAQWCSEGHDNLEPHDCDHIHCPHCGMHYSLESREVFEVETIEELRKLMFDSYTKNPISNKETILYELARAIRNVDGHDPHKQGRYVGRVLSKLRGIDPVKYDELVLQKE